MGSLTSLFLPLVALSHVGYAVNTSTFPQNVGLQRYQRRARDQLMVKCIFVTLDMPEVVEVSIILLVLQVKFTI